MLCAPIGYPPRKPVSSMFSLPIGMLKIFPNRRNMPFAFLPILLLIIEHKTKNGKSDGITVQIHSSTPAMAASKTSFESSINMSIPITASGMLKLSLLRLIYITHRKLFTINQKNNICIIDFLKRGKDYEEKSILESFG